MQNNGLSLQKQSVDAALKGDWKKAIDLNLLILEKFPDDMDTKARLGKAYLQVKDFTKAKKLFKEILDKDPINAIARKNYELAKEKNTVPIKTSANPKALIKEPGLSAEMFLESKKVFKHDLMAGEELKIRSTKKNIKVFRDKIQLGECQSPDILTALNAAKEEKAEVKAFYASRRDKIMKIIVRCTKPVFRAEKQAIKPYLKKGTLKEPELEITELDIEEEE
jgi:tetratricopeptide (TPR) repeat protein